MKTKHPINPAKAGFTKAESEVYKLLLKRCNSGLVTKARDLSEALKRDRTCVFRSLQSLINKGAVERYSSFFYRLKN